MKFSALLIAAVIVALAGPSTDTTALKEAREILSRMVEKQRAAKTVLIRFEVGSIGPDGDPLPKTAGSLLSADSGRFRLVHAQGVVVCDGRTLWQYSPANKQVMVKSAADAIPSGAEGALLRFLGAKALRAERAKNRLRVALDPEGTGESLDSLVLILDPGGFGLRQVETVDPAGARVVYSVKSLKLGARVRAGDFSFAPPAGAETVDMR